MENQTTFDLNHAIQRWRENLAQSPVFRSENLNELESHLRDSVATLQTRGLSAAESFLIASRRIGETRQLETEFGKTNRATIGIERLLWMLIGVQAWLVASGIAGSISQCVLLLGWGNTNHSLQNHGLALPVSLLVLMRFCLLAMSAWLCWWIIFRRSGKFGQWLEAKLLRRSSFIGYCIAAIASLIVMQSVIFGISMLLIRRTSPGTLGETSFWLSTSSTINHFLGIIALIVLTLFLVRKRASANAAPTLAR